MRVSLVLPLVSIIASCGDSASTATDEGPDARSDVRQAVDGTSGAKCSSPSTVTRSAVPRSGDEGVGEVTATAVCVPEHGVITTITLRYAMDSFFGEPTRQAIFSYDGDFEVVDAEWVVQVFGLDGEPIEVDGEDVYVGWEEGVWAGSGDGFGWDSTGSPSWSETFAHYSPGDAALTEFIDADAAKDIYRAGFTLDRLRFITVNDSPVLY